MSKPPPESKPWSLAVRALIADEAGRWLVLRRSAACRNFRGCWEWPGGKVEAGEEFVVALAREAMEECGLEVEPDGFVGATSFEMPAVRVVLLCLRARVTGGRLGLSDEHDEHAWLTLEELVGRPVVESLRPVLEAMRASQPMNVT